SRAILQENANLKTLPPAIADSILRDADAYQSAMQSCDLCIVSTPGLVVAASEAVSKPVFLWRNAIDAESTHIVNELEQGADSSPLFDSDQHKLTIAYVSGSKAHDQDFSSIASALGAILSRHNHATL